jgi:hypothetical protein
MTYEQNKQLTTLACHVQRFTKERQFLKGVSPATLEWYESSFKALAPVLERRYQSTAQIKQTVLSNGLCAYKQKAEATKAVSLFSIWRSRFPGWGWYRPAGITSSKKRSGSVTFCLPASLNDQEALDLSAYLTGEHRERRYLQGQKDRTGSCTVGKGPEQSDWRNRRNKRAVIELVGRPDIGKGE